MALIRAVVRIRFVPKMRESPMNLRRKRSHSTKLAKTIDLGWNTTKYNLRDTPGKFSAEKLGLIAPLTRQMHPSGRRRTAATEKRIINKETRGE
jgi:hypothetical protein